jgi:hypothetical protein
MNEAVRVREGFQQDQRPRQDTQPRQVYEEPKQQKLHLEMPPPEITPSPAEEDERQAQIRRGALPVVEQWPIVVRLLHKPIQNDRGEEVSELTFREPKGGDINRFGNPVRINQDGDVLIEERKMHYMMGALCGILAPRLDQMDPRDWNSCAYRLRNFFLPDPTAW